MKNIIFMGTPYFAKQILQTLLDYDYHVLAVVTQPDKPVGRKQILTPSEVKTLALENNLKVIQPIKIRYDYQEIIDLKPDLIITCAYGQIIPKALLESCLCLNVHASLLPKLRGGAPMQRAILNGDNTTGITIMTMSEKMDAGDIISQAEVSILENDTLGSLEEKLIACAKPLLIKTLKDIENNKAIYQKQVEEEATFGYVITKEEEVLSFKNEKKLDLYNHIRALIPAPYAYAYLNDGLKLKICSVRNSNIDTSEEDGTIVGLVDNSIGIAKEKTLLLVDEVLLEGKSKNTAKEFLNGAGRKYLKTILK